MGGREGNSTENHMVPALWELTENQCSLPKREVSSLQNGDTKESSEPFPGAWESVSYWQSSYCSDLLSPLSVGHAQTLSWESQCYQTSGPSLRHLLPYPERLHPDSRSLTISIYRSCHFHDNLSKILNFLSVGCQANTSLALSESPLFKMSHIRKMMIQHTFMSVSNLYATVLEMNSCFFILQCHLSWGWGLYCFCIQFLIRILWLLLLQNRTLFNQVLMGGSTAQ